MKTLSRLVALLVLLSGVSSAGVNYDQGAQPASFGTSIVGSTYTVTGGAAGNLFGTVAVSSSTGVSCRNCFTRVFLQLSPASTFYLLDGNTTDYVIFGSALGGISATQLGNTVSLPEDHAGPLCMTAGNVTAFSIQTPVIASTGTANVADWEGYTWCGNSRNANN